jgi:hypothetical protein
VQSGPASNAVHDIDRHGILASALGVNDNLRSCATRLSRHRGQHGLQRKRKQCRCGPRFIRLPATLRFWSSRHEFDHLLTHATEVGPEAHQHAGGHALALAHETEKCVFRSTEITSDWSA